MSTIPKIPDKTILSVYDGQTIFSIFRDAEPVLDQLFLQAKQRRSEESLDAFRKMTEDVFMRRLYRIMKFPTEKVQIEEGNYLEVFPGTLALQPLMQKSIHTDTTHLRDYLIKMNMLC